MQVREVAQGGGKAAGNKEMATKLPQIKIKIGR